MKEDVAEALAVTRRADGDDDEAVAPRLGRDDGGGRPGP